jgi:predicted Zn finger-like uncharacterized protein
MDVSCKSCGAKLTIPDQKLPPNQAVTVACPRCKGTIRIEAGQPDEDPAPSKGNLDEAGPEGEEDSTPLDLFVEGTGLALVLDGNEENVAEINAALEELAYKPILPSSTTEAMGKLRFHHFDLIFLSEGFNGHDLERSPIIHYLNHLSMSERRKIFLVLLSEKFKTMDHMMAFAKSANLVVSPDDLSNLPLILRKAISDNEKFYKVFVDTLKEVGKE